MSDCADMLPQLLKLHSISKDMARLPNNEEVSVACKEYEAAMIPRAFDWVQKSGGTSFPVCVQVLQSFYIHELI